MHSPTTLAPLADTLIDGKDKKLTKEEAFCLNEVDMHSPNCITLRTCRNADTLVEEKHGTDTEQESNLPTAESTCSHCASQQHYLKESVREQVSNSPVFNQGGWKILVSLFCVLKHKILLYQDKTPKALWLQPL
jgi:hypothetical protein